VTVAPGGKVRSFPLLLVCWVIGTVALVAIAVGLWFVILDGSLRDFLQDARN